ncbi:MAG: ATP-binding cassette domain-containing protein [Clostridia bacterium]|nr:ATP-binding cassette domain-containing protein [Clostridia bacterium]
MDSLLTVTSLRKTFKLSKKQQAIQKTTKPVIVAVDDLSFSAGKGEIFGLLGPNGAGKTTTLRIIATLIRPDSGDVLIDGVSAVKNPEIIRGQIGFLTGELKLEDYFTPNYLFDFFAKLHKMDETVARERKERLFKQFGVDRFAEVRIRDLSSGMKQKISLVISVLHDPKIVIFDEPTNGLDIVAARNVTDFIRQLKEEGKTILLSTHIFSLVEELCDRVGIIIGGKMALEGDYRTLTAERSISDVFFELYDREAGEGR